MALALLLRSSRGMSHFSSTGDDQRRENPDGGVETRSDYDVDLCSKSLPNNFLSQVYVSLVHLSHSTSCIIHVFTQIIKGFDDGV
jgi:SET domain-containing protein